MSHSIDERIVGMQFDNGQFEKNADKSLKTLDRLTKATDFSNSTKSLNAFEKAIGQIDLSSLADSVITIANRFSFMGIVGDQIIRKLTDGFLNLANSAAKAVKSLSLDQINVGWNDYAVKTSAVQTIMAATAKDFSDTGEQMSYVSEQLEKLNWFTDETSYNFMDMVSNIGKFTSANVALDDAVTAMQGIATWAAISGANAQDASAVMYQLSQAMGAGVIKGQDWMSVMTRNMATKEFKETVLEVAAAEGTLIKVGEGLYKTLEGNAVSATDFQSNLKDAWFTSEVFIKSLDKYGGFTNKLYAASNAFADQYDTVSELLDAVDEYKEGTLDISEVAKNTKMSVEEVTKVFEELSSETLDLGKRSFRAAQEAKTFEEAIDSVKKAVSTGWMNSFELIFGNYQEAKRLWTDVANSLWDLFAGGIEGRNKLLKEWHNTLSFDGTYYNTFANAIINLLDGLNAAKELLQEIFGEILPSINLDTLTGLTDKFSLFSKKFKYFFTGDKKLFADGEEKKLTKVEILAQKAVRGLTAMNDTGAESSKWLDAIDKKFKEIPVYGPFDNIDRNMQAFRDTISGVGYAFEILRKKFLHDVDTFRPLIKVFKVFGEELLQVTGSIGRMLGRANGMIEFSDNLKKVFENISDKAIPAIQNASKKVTTFIDTLFRNPKDKITPKIENLANKLNITSDQSRGLRDALLDVDKSFKEPTRFVKVLNKLSDALNNIKEYAVDLFNKVKESLSQIDLTLIIANLKKTFGGFGSLLSIFAKVIGSIGKGLPSFIGFLGTIIEKFVEITGKVGEMVSSFNDSIHVTDVFGKVFEKLGKIFEKLYSFISPVVDKIKELLKQAWDDPLEALHTINEFIASFIGIKGLTLLTYYTDMIGDTIRSVVDNVWAFETAFENLSFLEFAGAILTLAFALRVLSKIDTDSIGSAIVAMASLLGIVIGFAAAMRKLNEVDNPLFGKNSFASTMIKMAISMVVFAESLSMISKIKPESLWTSVAAFGVILAEIALFAAAFQKIILGRILPYGNKQDKVIKAFAKILTSLGIALLEISIALKIVGSIDTASLLHGVIAIGAILAEMAAFFAVLSKVGNTKIYINTSAFIGMATAIGILAVVIAGLSLLDPRKITMGVATIGTLLVAIAAYINFVSVNIPGLLAGAAALLIVSSSLGVFAIAMLALGALSTEGITKALMVLGIGLLELGIAVAIFGSNLIGVAGLIAVAVALNLLIPPLIALSVIPFGTIVKVLGELLLGVVTLAIAGAILSGVAAALISGSLAIAAFSAALMIAGAALFLIGTGIAAIGTGIIALVKAVEVVAEGIGNVLASIIGIIVKVIAAIVEILIKSIPSILAGIGAIILAIFEFFAVNAGAIATYLIYIIGGIVNAIADNADYIVDTIVNALFKIINAVANAIRKAGEKIGAAIMNLLSAILEMVVGILEFFIVHALPGYLQDKAKGIFTGIKDGIRQGLAPESLQDISEDAIDGFNAGINNKAPETKAAANGISGALTSGLSGIDLSGTGSDAMSDYLGGFSLGGEMQIPGVASDMTDLLSSSMDANGGKLNSSGEEAGDEYVDGYKHTFLVRKEELDPFRYFEDKIQETGVNLLDRGEDAGEQYVKGLIRGLKSRNRDLTQASWESATTIDKTHRYRLEVSSPSKKAEEIGVYWNMGLIKGLLEYLNPVKRASEEVTDTMTGSIIGALQNALDTEFSSDDLNPVITPIVDLSEVATASDRLSELLDPAANTIMPTMAPANVFSGDEANRPINSKNYGGVSMTIVQRQGEDANALAKRIMEMIETETEKREAALA